MPGSLASPAKLFYNQLKLACSNFLLSGFVPLEMEQNDPCQMFLKLLLKTVFFIWRVGAFA